MRVLEKLILFFEVNNMLSHLLSHRRTPYHIHALPHVGLGLVAYISQCTKWRNALFFCVFCYAVMVWLNGDTLCVPVVIVNWSTNPVKLSHLQMVDNGLTSFNHNGVTAK